MCEAMWEAFGNGPSTMRGHEGVLSLSLHPLNFRRCAYIRCSTQTASQRAGSISGPIAPSTNGSLCTGYFYGTLKCAEEAVLRTHHEDLLSKAMRSPQQLHCSGSGSRYQGDIRKSDVLVSSSPVSKPFGCSYVWYQACRRWA